VTDTSDRGGAPCTAAEKLALAELVFALERPKSVRAIAARLGCSKERVRLIEVRALDKLRRAAAGWRDHTG